MLIALSYVSSCRDYYENMSTRFIYLLSSNSNILLYLGLVYKSCFLLVNLPSYLFQYFFMTGLLDQKITGEKKHLASIIVGTAKYGN